jgi:phenylalanyl-tRNA synthetase alpha chain
MKLNWTEIQKHRLKALNAPPNMLKDRFETANHRNRAFQVIEKQLVRQERARLAAFLTDRLRPRLCVLESHLISALNQHGFAQVATPAIISQTDLERMSISKNHPLNRQIYQVDSERCLRPMLAPNLYKLMRDLARVSKEPIKIFEAGSCFRKESAGAQHASEFTMLNLVEMRLPLKKRKARLQELAEIVMTAAGIENYTYVTESSEVYGNTLDIVCGPDNLEVASCAMGPHPLDSAWRITDTWVGLGFGLERLLMASEGDCTLGKWRRSLSYLDGTLLKI